MIEALKFCALEFFETSIQFQILVKKRSGNFYFRSVNAILNVHINIRSCL